MRTTPFEEKELKRMDLRVRAYRENQWSRLEGFEPLEMAVLVCIAGACIGLLALMGLIIFWVKWIA